VILVQLDIGLTPGSKTSKANLVNKNPYSNQTFNLDKNKTTPGELAVLYSDEKYS
jgi:hypothetical protein